MQGGKLISPPEMNNIRVLLLAGDHYQMGYQHGVLLREQIEGFWEGLRADFIWSTAIDLVKNKGPHADDEPGETYLEAAVRNSDEFVKEQCEGMADALDDAVPAGDCVALASLMWILEDMIPRHVPYASGMLACSQFVARGPATASGELVHGRNMDWAAVEGVLRNPVVIVRQPSRGLKHASVAWPGMVGTLTGINEAGLSMAIDENGCPEPHRDLEGAPPLQLITRVLQQASSLEQAREMIQQAERATCQIFVVTDAASRSAELYEVTASGVGVHGIEGEDVLYAANHFAFTDEVKHQGLSDLNDLQSNSVTRLTRLRERLTGESLAPHPGLDRDAPDYAFGRIDVEMAIDIMRDPVDLRPDSDRFSFPCTEFEDGNWAVGNNHNLHSVIMLPEQLRIWIATGWDDQCNNPIYSPYHGLDLREVFEQGKLPTGRLMVYDPPYNGSYGNGIHQDE